MAGIIQFDSLIVTQVRSLNQQKAEPFGLGIGLNNPMYIGKVNYLIKGDIRYSTEVTFSEGKNELSEFGEVYTALSKYTADTLGKPIELLGSLIFTPTSVTIRLPYNGLSVISNTGPGLRQNRSSLTKVELSKISPSFPESLSVWVQYIDTQARQVANS
jgi:hypothetical protein